MLKLRQEKASSTVTCHLFPVTCYTFNCTDLPNSHTCVDDQC
ncbi:hypothetical protein [Trichormus sp. NMC-1]|nr:hypothetical protein [Trichormus sp. NMC-1]